MSKRIIGNYQLTESVFQNSFWELHKAKHTQTGKFYTVKQVSVQKYSGNSQLMECLLCELECLRNVEPGNVKVQRYESILKSVNNFYIIYERFYEVKVGAISLEKSVEHLN